MKEVEPANNLDARKKSPRKAQGPRGARTPFLFRERLVGASCTDDRLYSEANDGLHAERALRGPQDPKIPDADSSRGFNPTCGFFLRNPRWSGVRCTCVINEAGEYGNYAAGSRPFFHARSLFKKSLQNSREIAPSFARPPFSFSHSVTLVRSAPEYF